MANMPIKTNINNIQQVIPLMFTRGAYTMEFVYISLEVFWYRYPNIKFVRQLNLVKPEKHRL